MSNYNFTTSGLSGMLGDYSSIKNGSYSKLMKTYYSSASATSSATKSSSTNVLDKILAERKNPTVSKEVSEANAKLTPAVNSLKSSVNTLQNATTFEDTPGGSDAKSKTKAALREFVSSYNSAVEASKKSTNTSVTSNVAAIMQSTSEHEDALKEMGITINGNGTLSLSEYAMDEVDVSKVQDLFSTEDALGYGATVSSRLNRASYYTANVSATAAAESATTASSATDLSGSIDAILAKGASFEGDSGLNLVKDFVKNYNSAMDSAKNSTVSGVISNRNSIQTKAASQATALAGIGITVGSNGSLALNSDVYNTSGSAIKQATLQSFASGIKTNASLMSFYASSQSSTASTYGSGGTYTSGSDIVSSLYSQSI